MSSELTALALAGILQCAQVLLYAIPANLQVGLKYSLSPRDEVRPLEGVAGRAQRAMNNHFENLILFTLAVLVVTASGTQSGFTAGCAWVYLGARLLYIPAYVLGWVPWRSLFFATGWFATLAMLVAALVA